MKASYKLTINKHLCCKVEMIISYKQLLLAMQFVTTNINSRQLIQNLRKIIVSRSDAMKI